MDRDIVVKPGKPLVEEFSAFLQVALRWAAWSWGFNVYRTGFRFDSVILF
jgi:hypothetical protein